MKLSLSTFISLLFVTAVSVSAQDPATEAGEDFDLYAVMGLFEDAKDLEDFEKKLNSQDNDVNNLDLNKDDEVDLVRVVEHEDGSTHILVLQAVLGEDDFQDLAVIELEKKGEDDISGQIIGDEEIYGPDYIIEPAPEEASLARNYFMAVYVSVHRWTPVRVVFRPGRAIFISSVVWMPRPVWFRPWRPVARSSWRKKASRWHSPRFRTTKSRHSARGKSMYSSRRRSSPTAKKNYGPKPGPTTGPGSSPNQQQKKQQQTKQQQNKQQPKKKQPQQKKKK